MTMDTASPATSRGHLVTILVLGAMTAVTPLATDMYLAAFPAIGADLSASAGQVQFSLSIFFIGMAFGQLIYGTLIDRFGRKLPLMAGMAVFTLSSVAMPFAPDIVTFNGLRLLQAVGACSGMVIGRAAINDLFDATKGARVLSHMMLITGLGPILAPILGGYILISWGWQAIFMALAAIAAASLFAIGFAFRETLPPEKRQPQRIGETGRTYLKLLRNRQFVLFTLVGCFALGGLFAFITGSPHVMMDLYGLSQQTYGWVFAANAVAMVIGSQINGYLLRRHPLATVLKYSLLLSVVTGAATVALSGAAHLITLMIPLTLCLANVPVVAANSTALAMAACGKDAGAASGILGVLQFGIAGLVSGLVGMMANNSPLPMTVVIAAAAMAAFACFAGFQKDRRV